MNDADLDRRLAALLAAPDPAPDAAFAGRIVALAGHDRAVRRARRRAIAAVGGEALALVAALAGFALLARIVPAGQAPGGVIALGSPAMMGVVLLLMWGLVAVRDPACD